jgi:hypothetical protein
MIAGDGDLPAAIAQAASGQGRELVAVAFPGITDPGIEKLAARVAWLGPGQVDAALSFLVECGVRQAVMAGKVSKQALVAGRLEVDDRARRLLSSLSDWNDATLLSALGDEIEREGICLLAQAELVPDLLVPEGSLGRVHPTPDQWVEIGLGWPVARNIASLDIGQTVVVHERAIVAVEAIEGTDEAIRRAGRLAGEGLCIVKVARPDQDPRFDLPAIGPGTVEVAAEAGASVIAVEASRSLVVQRERAVKQADEAGIALVGVPSAGPKRSSGQAEPAD